MSFLHQHISPGLCLPTVALRVGSEIGSSEPAVALWSQSSQFSPGLTRSPKGPSTADGTSEIGAGVLLSRRGIFPSTKEETLKSRSVLEALVTSGDGGSDQLHRVACYFSALF